MRTAKARCHNHYVGVPWFSMDSFGFAPRDLKDLIEVGRHKFLCPLAPRNPDGLHEGTAVSPLSLERARTHGISDASAMCVPNSRLVVLGFPSPRRCNDGSPSNRLANSEDSISIAWRVSDGHSTEPSRLKMNGEGGRDETRRTSGAAPSHFIVSQSTNHA